MQHKESREPANQSRLLSVIILLVATFAIWFGVLLHNAQQDLNYMAERIKTDTLVTRRMHRTGSIVNTFNSGVAQVLFVSGAKLMSGVR